MTIRELDHPKVVEQLGVPRSERQSLPGRSQRVHNLSIVVQRPGESVVAVDVLTRLELGRGDLDGMGRVAMMRCLDRKSVV